MIKYARENIDAQISVIPNGIIPKGWIKVSFEEYQNQQVKIEHKEHINKIKQELETIDKQRTRALAEPEIKDETTNETWLDYYNKQAKELRQELKTLESPKDTQASELGSEE